MRSFSRLSANVAAVRLISTSLFIRQNVEMFVCKIILLQYRNFCSAHCPKIRSICAPCSGLVFFSQLCRLICMDFIPTAHNYR